MNLIQNDVREVGQRFCLNQFFQKNARCAKQNASVWGDESFIQSDLNVIN